LNTEREFLWRWRASREILSAEKENCAVSGCDVEVTRNAASTGEPIRKRFTGFFIEPAWKAALDIQASFEEGSGR
jgi:hypothetical protein